MRSEENPSHDIWWMFKLVQGKIRRAFSEFLTIPTLIILVYFFLGVGTYRLDHNMKGR